MPEDDALLTRLWADPMPLKAHLHLFAGRSYDSLIQRGKTLELPDRRRDMRLARSEATVGARIREQMELLPGTTLELSMRAIASKRTVQNFIERHRGDVHIVDYRPRGISGPPPAVFAWGAGEDLPRPEPQSPTVAARKYYRKRRRDPYQRELDAARQRIRYAERTGQLVKRDAAAIALFGDVGGAHGDDRAT
ncbi:hypothetical protein [Paraburkholderia fungorum]|uniref:hypothetical protein n=1 Tax=Paraburkholderia fungorum TaxID=134537 RepID=UPI000D04A6B2|nr:hypothetical protein [Paraburkholderia fungorum]